jgi:hypothetical protein
LLPVKKENPPDLADESQQNRNNRPAPRKWILRPKPATPNPPAGLLVKFSKDNTFGSCKKGLASRNQSGIK